MIEGSWWWFLQTLFKSKGYEICSEILDLSQFLKEAKNCELLVRHPQPRQFVALIPCFSQCQVMMRRNTASRQTDTGVIENSVDVRETADSHLFRRNASLPSRTPARRMPESSPTWHVKSSRWILRLVGVRICLAEKQEVRRD